MYGAAAKLNRSAGGPPIRGGRLSSNRPPSSAGRLSGKRPATSSVAAGGTEEGFSLVRGDADLDFAMIIRLAPELVDEIKKAEEMGGGARIRFDANCSNPLGNVIDVGGKSFRFTWSREVGDLCDIYEERQSGEDGDGLLVESGSAWRKLNVQRVLDDSVKNHVKKLSEEAERQQKSRKAIILDPKNPSMKNQMKALAAAETTPWRGKFQQKKEPEFKKRKIDTPAVSFAGPPKTAYKSGLPSTTSTAGRPSISPSPPPHSGASVSPFMTGNMAKGHFSAGDLSNTAMMTENVFTPEKEKFNKATTSVMQEKPVRKENFVAKAMDLENMLITLLTENPKGMSLKALEKAVGDSQPNSIKKIEPIIKKIAKFQAPGRYILKPGVEVGSLKRHLSDSGSSPDGSAQQTPVQQKHEDTSIPTSTYAQKGPAVEEEKQALFNLNLEQDTDLFDNVDIESNSPEPFGEKRISNISEGPAHSSSDSDSESNSSDSGSDSKSKSRSRSKSKSPVKSGSVSSSDSDSDASSNSKQGPDEDVDIISDDEDLKPNTQIPEPNFATSPVPFRDSDPDPAQNWYEERQDLNGSDVEIDDDVPNNPHQTVESDRDPQSGYMFSGREYVANDVSKHERPSKSKSKRGSDSKPPHEKSGHSKRLKPGNMPQQQLSRPREPVCSESPQPMYSDRVVEEAYKGRSSEVATRPLKDGSAYSGFHKSDNSGYGGKSITDYQNSGQRLSDPVGRARAIDVAERSDVQPESLNFDINSSGKNSNKSQKHFSLQENRVNSSFKGNSEGNAVAEKTPVLAGRGKKLQRELSELELGEFREPLLEATVEKKSFERKSSFKETGNRPSSSDYWNMDQTTERPRFRPGVSNNIETMPKRTPENKVEDIPKAQSRVLQSQPKVSQHPARAEVGSRKSGDTSGRYKNDEAREKKENGVGGLGDVHMNVPVSVSTQNDVEQGSVSLPRRDSKTQNINSFSDPGEVKKDASLTESSEGVVKRRESSSDENSCSFSKYEKEEPELKGPIKDFSQYKEYVQEYQEKYDSYCSLNKTLESYRNEFSKLGKDLESAKGRDVDKYYRILDQLHDSYRQCGDRHKRLKKIFVVLHEELQSLKQTIKDFATSYARE